MSDVLWTAADARTATGGQGSEIWQASGVVLDSRAVRPGDLFVALKGERVDGHDYVAQALAKGAAAALVERRPDGLGADAPLLVVKNALDGLRALGRAARARSSAKIAAVTGSVGKTGTKEMLARVLARQAATYASAGNLNSESGAPLALARLPADARYAVLELGMNKPGEIRANAAIVRPHVAVVTTVEAVHLEYFGSIEAIADAKAEIFEGLVPGGAAILNRDNPQFERLADLALAHGARILSFGEHEKADARATKIVVKEHCACIAATVEGESVAYKIAMPGRHWALNSLAVLLAVKALGADLGLAAVELAQAAPLRGRGERRHIRFPVGRFLLVDESYNASPVATKAAIESFASASVGARGRRIAVLGDMRELGPTAKELHAALAPALVAAKIDRVFTCGPLMRALHEALPAGMCGGHATDSTAVAPLIAGTVRAGDAVLVKGSLGSRMAVVVDALEALDCGEAGEAAD